MDVGLIAVDGVADFGLCALLEVLSTAVSLRSETDGAGEPWTVTPLGVRSEVITGFGHRAPTTPIASLSRLPDVLVMPAVSTRNVSELTECLTSRQNSPILDLLGRARSGHAEMAAACTGTFFLAEAGVLDGEMATTSWWLAPFFRRRYPKVDLQEGLILSQGEGLTTAGAAFSHIDLALAIVRSHSPDLAELVDRYLLIGSKASQAAFAIPAVMAGYDPLTSAFERWVRGHLTEPIQVGAVAQQLGVSERTLQRTTAEVLGMSPVELINAIRLDRATQLLRTTNLTAAEIATRVGYLNVSTLRSLFHRRGTTMSELRRNAPQRV
ncbi:helix-turn-helix domain-containing protein [Kribbella sp. NPDC056861]|uniref:GlxA family transcriptional regulator n=1 Tax=Kribbella sp. NPDC056861 TaxID=3154857 RepID=UPI00343A50D0